MECGSEARLAIRNDSADTRVNFLNNPAIMFGNGDLTNGNYVGLQFTAPDSSGNWRYGASIEAITVNRNATGIDSELEFLTRDMTAGSGVHEAIRINKLGRVGIETSTPGQKLEVNGGICINTTDSKPTCDSSTRGTFWFTQGGTGVADSVEVCSKDASDAYAWRTLI